MEFCLSTGHWIAYECLLDPGTAILLRKPTDTVWVFNSEEQHHSRKDEGIHHTAGPGCRCPLRA